MSFFSLSLPPPFVKPVEALGKHGSQTRFAEGIWKHEKLSLTSSCVGQDRHR